MGNTQRKEATMNNERETCGICSQDYLVKNTKDHQCETDNTDLYLAIIEDISNVIAEHLPRFDNNITAATWRLLEQFTDETITQLTKKEN
jgi:hypothetical protein